eukprot:TRINITY_DN1581_c0_g1_i2.p1 TRINITY_DN1581_c0_g1~~TRINITY_DN1581_c0_g1_i2.p1  ORF type:complete len:157 (-),score=17.31 TRINITY_DN1581_c0_g1_i2:113-583(-)
MPCVCLLPEQRGAFEAHCAPLRRCSTTYIGRQELPPSQPSFLRTKWFGPRLAHGEKQQQPARPPAAPLTQSSRALQCGAWSTQGLEKHCTQDPDTICLHLKQVFQFTHVAAHDRCQALRNWLYKWVWHTVKGASCVEAIGSHVASFLSVGASYACG